MAARLNLSGRPRLFTEDGREITLPRKAHVIAAALFLDHRDATTSRRDLGKLLWERCDYDRRAGNLRQLLNRVRAIQEKERIEVFAIEADHVTLLRDRLEIDLAVVVGARADWADHRIVDLCRAYGGDLLDGCDETGVAYTKWLWSHRAALRHRFVSLVGTNLEAASGSLEADDILICAKRLLAADALNEVAQRCLLRLHAARGETAAAARIKQRLADRIHHQDLESATREAGSSPPTPHLPIVADDDSAVNPIRRPSGPGIRRDLPRLLVRTVTADGLPGEDLDRFRNFLDDATIGFWRSGAVTVVPMPPESSISATPGRFASREFLFDCRLGRYESTPTLTSSLRSVDTGEIMWIQRYGPQDVDLTALMDLVRSCLRHIEDAELFEASSGNVSIGRSILKAARLLKTTDLKAVRRARGLLRSVLNDEPENVRAMALMSRARRQEWLLLARPDSDLLREAVGIARSAVLVDPDAAAALQQFGVGNIYARNHDIGLQALFRARDLAPHDHEIIADLADGLINAGRIDEGLELISPLLGAPELVNDQMLWNAASGLYLAGRYEKALAMISRLSSDEPASQLAAACHAMVDRREEAGHLVARTIESIPHFDVAGRLQMAPLKRREDFDHYAEGLCRAGFD